MHTALGKKTPVFLIPLLLGVRRKKVGAATHGTFNLLLTPPPGNSTVVARQQDRRTLVRALRRSCTPGTPKARRCATLLQEILGFPMPQELVE